jgi:hypothetical protein
MKSIILLLCALAASGCTTLYVPTRGASADDFAVAKWNCTQQTQRGGEMGASGSQRFVVASMLVMVTASATAQHSNFTTCMAAAGWVPQA